MLRRNFVKCAAAAVGVGLIGATPMINESWKTGPVNLIWNDKKGVWQIDPFIDVVLKKDQDAVVDNHRFAEMKNGNCMVSTTSVLNEDDKYFIFLYDINTDMCSKETFLKYCAEECKDKKVNYYRIFNHDKSKVTLFATPANA